MKVHLPRNENFPLVRMTVKAGTWTETSVYDQSSHLIDVVLPEGIDESEVDVRADFCNGRGEIIETGFNLKTGTPKAPPKKPEPKVEPKKPEPKPELKSVEKPTAEVPVKAE